MYVISLTKPASWNSKKGNYMVNAYDNAFKNYWELPKFQLQIIVNTIHLTKKGQSLGIGLFLLRETRLFKSRSRRIEMR